LAGGHESRVICRELSGEDAVWLWQEYLHGSEEALRAEIGRQIRAGRRNGSPVTPGTSAERVRRYRGIAHDLGRS
jgi:hypothetical protein